MLDLQQGLATNQMVANSGSFNKWEEDFDFWGEQEQRTSVHDNYGCSSRGDELEFEAMPLNHHYTYPSPRSRLQAIIDGRRELMEMIKDLPESFYELSLKDIVDADTNDIEINERSVNVKPQVKVMQQKKRNYKGGRIGRSESMDSGVFLLKMFLPFSWGSKRTGNHSKLSRRPSLERSEKLDKEWWKMRFLAIEGSKSSGSSSSSNGSTSSCRSRHDDINFTPGCWSFCKNYTSSSKRGRLL